MMTSIRYAFTLASLFTSVLSCGGSSAPVTKIGKTESAHAGPDTVMKIDDPDSAHAILDLDDRCSWLPDCRQPFADNDGCPEPEINFAEGSSVISDKQLAMLRNMAAELTVAECVRLVEVVAYDSSQDPKSAIAMARADAIVRVLTNSGVASTILQASAGRTHPDRPDPAYGAVFIVECIDPCLEQSSE